MSIERKSPDHVASTHTKTAVAASSTTHSDWSMQLQTKYRTAESKLERYNQLSKEISKFREWQAKLRLSGVPLTKEQEKTYGERLAVLKLKVEEGNQLRQMIQEQRLAKAAADMTTAAAAVRSKPLLSNGKAAPKPGAAPSRIPTTAELSKRISAKHPTIAEKHARRTSLRKEVDAFSEWISKAQIATLTEDQKRIVNDKKALLEVKKREIELLSSILRDQEAKQRQEVEEKEAAMVEDPFAQAAEEAEEKGGEDLTAQKEAKQPDASSPPQEEQTKQSEAEKIRHAVSPTLNESPSASSVSAEPSSSPPVLRHAVSVVSSNPKPAPKVAVRPKSAAPVVDSKKRKAISEDDVADPFSPASPASHAMSDDDKDEDWEASKKSGAKKQKGGKGASKKKAASKVGPSAAKRAKSVGGGRSSVSKPRSKPASSSLLSSSAKSDPFSFDNLRLDLMPQTKSSKKPGKSLLLNVGKK